MREAGHQTLHKEREGQNEENRTNISFLLTSLVTPLMFAAGSTIRGEYSTSTKTMSANVSMVEI